MDTIILLSAFSWLHKFIEPGTTGSFMLGWERTVK